MIRPVDRDLATMLKHAFLSGVVAARNIPGHEECVGVKLWVDYDPTGEAAFDRVCEKLK